MKNKLFPFIQRNHQTKSVAILFFLPRSCFLLYIFFNTFKYRLRIRSHSITSDHIPVTSSLGFYKRRIVIHLFSRVSLNVSLFLSSKSPVMLSCYPVVLHSCCPVSLLLSIRVILHSTTALSHTIKKMLR